MSSAKCITSNSKQYDGITGISESKDIVPDSFENDTFDIIQEIENFKGFISQNDPENAKNSLLTIIKYIDASSTSPLKLLGQETVAFLISLLKTEADGPQKFNIFAIKKNILSILVTIAKESSESAAFLIENNVFSELNPLLVVTSDTFSAKLTSELFLCLLEHGEDFCKNALENGILDATFEAIHHFLVFDSKEYLQNICSLLNILLKIIDFTDLIEEGVIDAIIKETASIASKISTMISTPPVPVNPLFPDDPFANVPPSIFEVSIVEAIAHFISECPEKNPAIVSSVFENRIVFMLNDILKVPRAGNTYEPILMMDANLAISLSSEEELLNALLDSIDPAMVMHIFIREPFDKCAGVALKYLNNAISVRETIISQLPLEEFVQVVSERFHEIGFSLKVEIVRVSLAIMWQGGDEFFEVLLSQGILQSFVSVFADGDSGIKLYSVLTFSRIIERYATQGKNCDDLKGFLGAEYKELLDSWCESPDSQLSEASVLLIDAIEE